MAIIFALESLYNDVVATFAADGTNAPNIFGWRTPPQKFAGVNRVCWVPGDDVDAGEIAGARFPGQNPRPLATLVELFTVYLLTADVVSPENELAQYKAARTLFDAWYRAAYLSAHGTFSIDRVEWLNAQKERRFGAGLKVVCRVEAQIPDEAAPDANEGVDVAALIDTTLLNVTEQDEIEGDA
jgi:hypothetical protein